VSGHVVGNAIYRDGRRIATPATLEATFQELKAHPDAMAWIGLYRPTDAELQQVAEEYDLHPLALEDAIHRHQRPKVERYDQTLFMVLKAARYLDEVESVEFGELHVFAGPNFIITVRH